MHSSHISPCVDFSGLNAYGQGLQGEQGALSLLVANFLKDVQRNAKQLASERPVFFILENVGTMRDEDRDKLSDNFGSYPIRLDSAFFSPTVRDRLYWT
jgi:site-specific DNA-cytosine methylase